MTHNEIYRKTVRAYDPVTGQFFTGTKKSTIGDYIGYALANGVSETEICWNIEKHFKLAWTFTKEMIARYLVLYE